MSHACPDGKRLYAEASVSDWHQFQVVFTNAVFKAKLTFDTWIGSFVAFRDQLEALNRDLKGKATLSAIENDLDLEVTVDKLGHLTWTGVLRYPGGIPESTLEFTIEDDQTSLDAAITEISSIIAEASNEQPQEAATKE